MSAFATCRRIGGHNRLRAQMIKRLLHRSEIAGAKINDRDHSNPFVLGSSRAICLSRQQAARKRSRERLEQRFNLVMIGAAVENSRMNIGLRAAGKAVKEIVHQFGLQIADQPYPDFRIHDCRRAPRKIHRCEAQAFHPWA